MDKNRGKSLVRSDLQFGRIESVIYGFVIRTTTNQKNFLIFVPKNQTNNLYP